MRPLLVLAAVLLTGCRAPEAPRELRSTHANGFLILDDGTLAPKEIEKLSSELAAAQKQLLAIFGKHSAPADFRKAEERASCPPPVPPAETHVTVISGNGRCHADETGITILRNHIDRKDATHELVHYLAGGSWRPADEGLAVYLTEKLWGASGGISLDVRARVYMDLSLDQGLDRDRLGAGMTRIDYDLAGSFVKWLVAERGIDAFFSLYRGAAGDYHGVFGVPEQELVAKWREQIKAMNVRQDGSYYKFKDFMSR